MTVRLKPTPDTKKEEPKVEVSEPEPPEAKVDPVPEEEPETKKKLSPPPVTKKKPVKYPWDWDATKRLVRKRGE